MTENRDPVLSNPLGLPASAPESGTVLTDVGTLEASDLLSIDEICDAYEAAWRTSSMEPCLQDFLEKVRTELQPLAQAERRPRLLRPSIQNCKNCFIWKLDWVRVLQVRSGKQ